MAAIRPGRTWLPAWFRHSAARNARMFRAVQTASPWRPSAVYSVLNVDAEKPTERQAGTDGIGLLITLQKRKRRRAYVQEGLEVARSLIPYRQEGIEDFLFAFGVMRRRVKALGIDESVDGQQTHKAQVIGYTEPP